MVIIQIMVEFVIGFVVVVGVANLLWVVFK